MIGEEDQFSQDNTAGGIGDEGIGNEFDTPQFRKDTVSHFDQLHEMAANAGAQAMGANAAQRWAGTPSIGLSLFKRREPVFGFTGANRHGQPEIRKRIDASTHMAEPPSGLVGGQALVNQQRGVVDKSGRPSAFTPTEEWGSMFPKYGGGNKPPPAPYRANVSDLPRIASAGPTGIGFRLPPVDPGAFAYGS